MKAPRHDPHPGGVEEREESGKKAQRDTGYGITSLPLRGGQGKLESDIALIISERNLPQPSNLVNESKERKRKGITAQRQ